MEQLNIQQLTQGLIHSFIFINYHLLHRLLPCNCARPHSHLAPLALLRNNGHLLAAASSSCCDNHTKRHITMTCSDVSSPRQSRFVVIMNIAAEHRSRFKLHRYLAHPSLQREACKPSTSQCVHSNPNAMHGLCGPNSRYSARPCASAPFFAFLSSTMAPRCNDLQRARCVSLHYGSGVAEEAFFVFGGKPSDTFPVFPRPHSVGRRPPVLLLQSHTPAAL